VDVVVGAVVADNTNLSYFILQTTQPNIFFQRTLCDFSSLTMLARWYDYRQTDWSNYLEYPEFTLKQTQQLLRIGI